LRADVLPVAGAVWSLLDILSGIPLLGPATIGEFVPQMLNLEALGGLSFTKGCYPGQEVVARLHYRGQLKRRLYLAHIVTDEVPPAGAKLYGPGTAESVGMVVSAARSGPGMVAVLAVVVIEQKALGGIRLGDAQGPVLEFSESDAELEASV
jgi:folate-binding protein YgfZ